MSEFLLEIFSEEIPARMQVQAAEDIKNIIAKGMKENNLSFDEIKAHSTPRRIIIVVDGLPKKQEDMTIEKRGPRTDAPEKAVEGFLRANGLSSTDACEKREMPKGEFWFYVNQQKGLETKVILADILDNMFKTFVWPKSMRWKTSEKAWVRPMHSIIAILDKDPIPFTYEAGGKEEPIKAGNITIGHRFLANKEIKVKDFADYKAKLKKAYVLIDREDRKEIIVEQANKLAAKENLQVKEDAALLEEVIGLVEWPVPLICSFEEDFLEVPSEVLLSTMKKDQKYLGLIDSDGKLSNRFVVIANTITTDKGAMVINGNEKVVRARLSDAKFFWDQDKKHSLESRNPRLAEITFHKKLGTVFDKVTRVEKLSTQIADMLGNDRELAARAAVLCKSDLVSSVVYEFPGVQGVMGRYYAENDGEDQQVANAISDHYKPVGANDDCPTQPISICVALADKIDTLIGFFSINEKPTGSKDPFALRRAALGIIRILIENKINVSLGILIELSYKLYADTTKGVNDLDTVREDLFKFFCDRLKVTLKDQHIDHGILDAVFANIKTDYNIYEIYKLSFNVKEFLSSDNGANLITAYKRSANMLHAEEKKDKKLYLEAELDEALLKEAVEQQLNKALSEVSAKISDSFKDKDFTSCMEYMAELREPVDAFFKDIMVNEAEFRTNRLCLLAKLRSTVGIIADFSKI